MAWSRSLIFGDRVRATLRDSYGKPLVPEYLDGPPRRVTGDTEQVHEIFLRRQWILVWTEITSFDPGAQPCRDLPVRRHRATPVDLGHVHDHKLADQRQSPSLAYVARRRPTIGVRVAAPSGSRGTRSLAGSAVPHGTRSHGPAGAMRRRAPANV